MELLVTVNTQNDHFPAHGRHYLLPQLLVVENIFELSHMMHLKVSSFLATVFTFIGLQPLGDFCSGERKVQDAGLDIHRLPLYSGYLERFE